MKIKLTSYGAAGQVTGSNHLLSIDGFNILIDCGLFQGDHESYLKNWNAFDFDARDIDAVVLTHAHLDHCGRLPRLIAQGYRGKIYCTPATAELAEVVLEDNLHIMAEKAAYEKLPALYSAKDIQTTRERWKHLNYYQTFSLSEKINLTLFNAGHILGSSMAMIETDNKKILFTGDLGAKNMPLVKDADEIKQADYVILDSTYGDRVHEQTKVRDQRLLDHVQKITIKNSTLVISVFAIERTQDILKVLNDYYEKHLDFKVPVYLDSPMAESATQVYSKYQDQLNQKSQDTLRHDNDIFSFPHLHIMRTVNDSKKINSVPAPKIIVTGSGMAEGGRILHHLAHYAPNKNDHILFMGFQVPGTLGHSLTSGAFDFDYFGKKVKVAATIEKQDGFSAHADQSDIIDWLNNFSIKPKKVFLAHGDQTALDSLQTMLKKKLSISAESLTVGKKYDL